MGRVSFADAIYLLLVGELPSPSVSRMISAILVSSVDHGAMPPSTVVSRNVATTGAPLRAAVAAGVLSFGSYHGGDVEGVHGPAGRRPGAGARRPELPGCGRDDGDSGSSTPASACPASAIGCTRTIRARYKLLQMAYELDLEGEHIRLMRVVDRALAEALGPDQRKHPHQRRRRDRRRSAATSVWIANSATRSSSSRACPG